MKLRAINTANGVEYFDVHGRTWTRLQAVDGTYKWCCDEGNQPPVDEHEVKVVTELPRQSGTLEELGWTSDTE